MSEPSPRLNIIDPKATTPERVFRSVQSDISLYRDSLSLLADFLGPMEEVLSQTFTNELTILKRIDEVPEGH